MEHLPSVSTSHRKVEPPPSGHLFGSLTLAIWLSVLTVGWLGGQMQYPQASIPPRPRPPVAVQDLKLELTGDDGRTGPELPAVEPDAAPAEPLPVPPAAVPELPQAPLAQDVRELPPLLDLAVPSPAISFAVPVEEPPRVQAAAPATAPALAANVGRVVGPAGLGAAPPRPLTLGVGEGRQPRPLYPSEALRRGQQGRIMVRLTVGENGRVASAEAVEPCPWPLLNEAAVRTVRDRWRFSAGEVRVYQVSIVFRLE